MGARVGPGDGGNGLGGPRPGGKGEGGEGRVVNWRLGVARRYAREGLRWAKPRSKAEKPIRESMGHLVRTTKWVVLRELSEGALCAEPDEQDLDLF